MGQTTIEWTATHNEDGTVTPGFSFNPWVGCQKVSPGCKHCYAETFMTRKGRWANTWGPPETSERLRTSEGAKPLQWNKQARAEGRRAKVFCASLADVFEDNPQVEPWRADLWQLIEQTPNLDWLLLTKRPENIEKSLPDSWLWNLRVPQNIWFGISAENQDALDERWPVFESFAHSFHPAILFLSLEPLLGPIDLDICSREIDIGDEEHSWWTRPVDWVIVGGESGQNARPMHPEWARSLRDQCVAAGVPFFFKQWGAFCPPEQSVPLGTKMYFFEADGRRVNPDAPFREIWDRGGFQMWKPGKYAAGRLLDGREWHEMPD